MAKMPVVIGQAIVAPCLRAIAARNSVVVTSRPRGTCRIRALTSAGAGMAQVPVPQRVLILPVIWTTFGRPLLNASFSRQVLRRAIGYLGISRVFTRLDANHLGGVRHLRSRKKASGVASEPRGLSSVRTL